MTRTMLVSLTGIVALAAASCGSSSAEGPRVMAQASPEAAAVNVQLFQFQPNELTVRAGARVTWTNRDQIQHTVTSGTPENRDRRFDGPLNGQGTTFSHTF